MAKTAGSPSANGRLKRKNAPTVNVARQGRTPGHADGPRNWASMGAERPKRAGYDGASCHCGRPAHFIVGREGFCRDHKSDAFAAQSKRAFGFANRHSEHVED